MKNHVQPGVFITVMITGAIGAVNSGDLIQVGDLACVTAGKAAVGETVECAIDEVFSVPKLPADVMPQGAIVYLDAANKRVTLTANNGGNLRAGKVTTSAAANTAFVNLKLNA